MNPVGTVTLSILSGRIPGIQVSPPNTAGPQTGAVSVAPVRDTYEPSSMRPSLPRVTYSPGGS